MHAHSALLLRRFRQLQLGTESRGAELSAQARLHAAEAERALLLKEETAQALARCQTQCEKQQKKVQVEQRRRSGPRGPSWQRVHTDHSWNQEGPEQRLLQAEPCRFSTQNLV